MDRLISEKEQRIEARKKWLKIGGVAVLTVSAVILFLTLIFSESVKESDLTIGKAEMGTLESSVSASGKIVPLYEQTIVSPVSTRILEVFCTEGDTVDQGESLLRLDIQSTETEFRRMSDEVSMKRNELERTSLNSATFLTDLEMKIKAKEMAVNHLKAEVANEKRLDSIGSGTGDRIREAEMAYSTGLLELDQLRMQLNNERKAHAAAYRSKQLEETITSRNLEEVRRTLDDARVKAPRKGTVTFLNKKLGASISAGEQLAVVSDLTHFKVSGELAESNAGKLSIGSEVKIRIGNRTITGRIGNISPQSVNSHTSFTVLLDDDSQLRSGLSVEMNVIYDVYDNVVRIPNGQYFQGPGSYFMFVKTSKDRIERRSVELGNSNFDYVEVKRGISPGEEVVVSDMSTYKNHKSIKLK